MLKRAFLSGLMLLGTVLPLAAQELPDTSWVPTNRLSAGVCIAPSLSPLLFATYSRSINPDIELEAALQNSSWSSFQLARDQPIVGIDKYDLSFNNSMTIDATALFSLQDRRKDIHYNFSRLRFGGGVSLQYYKFGYAPVYYPQRGSNQDSVLIYPTIAQGGSEILYFGINAKFDYLLPVSRVIDIGLRGQYHLLFHFPGQGTISFGGGLSLGAFASVRF